jgi:hypothetical protein
MIVIEIVSCRGGSKLATKNAAVRREILEKGRKGTATIISAKARGTQFQSEERTLMNVKCRIKMNDTGREYVLVREVLAVPLPYVSEFKINNVLPVTVHRGDSKMVLFEFDETGSASDITFEDSYF